MNRQGQGRELLEELVALDAGFKDASLKLRELS